MKEFQPGLKFRTSNLSPNLKIRSYSFDFVYEIINIYFLHEIPHAQAELGFSARFTGLKYPCNTEFKNSIIFDHMQ